MLEYLLSRLGDLCSAVFLLQVHKMELVNQEDPEEGQHNQENLVELEIHLPLVHLKEIQEVQHLVLQHIVVVVVEQHQQEEIHPVQQQVVQV